MRLRVRRDIESVLVESVYETRRADTATMIVTLMLAALLLRTEWPGRQNRFSAIAACIESGWFYARGFCCANVFCARVFSAVILMVH